MTKPERIRKLTNAIKAWRGAHDSRTGKWVRAPQPARVDNVVHWLLRLNRRPEQIQTDLLAIVGFKKHEEMCAWVADLDKTPAQLIAERRGKSQSLVTSTPTKY